MKKVNYYTPSEIIDRATEHMVVLETQKAFTEQMATMLSMHLAKVQAMDNSGYSFNQLPVASCFVVSPTGTGKSYILKALAKATGMNTSFIDSTQLTQAGYKGLNLMEAIAKIVDDDPHFFETANMLVFDEFDKTFFDPTNSDYNAHNVQRDLLKLFEGSQYNIRGSGDIGGKTRSINLDRTFIVLAGACSRINRVLENRYTPKAKLGFSLSESCPAPETELIKQADINDLVEYGMLRELAGRVNSVFHIGSLSKEDYKTIITADSKVSAIAQYRNLFKSRGCKLSISGTAVNKIADIAVSRKMGARTVNAVLNEQISSAYSFLENHTDYNKAILCTDAADNFVLNYKKGERQQCLTSKAQESHLLYNLHKELISENSIDVFCNTVCSLARLNEPNEETFLYSFLQLSCRYFVACIRPSERTVNGLIKLAKATNRPCANGVSPFEIICSDYLEIVSNKNDSDKLSPTAKHEFVEAFEVFFEIYKESYLPSAEILLSEKISQTAKHYVDNNLINNFSNSCCNS